MKKMIFLKVKNSYNKKLVTWLDLNLQVALKNTLLERIQDIITNKYDNFRVNIQLDSYSYGTISNSNF